VCVCVFSFNNCTICRRIRPSFAQDNAVALTAWVDCLNSPHADREQTYRLRQKHDSLSA